MRLRRNCVTSPLNELSNHACAHVSHNLTAQSNDNVEDVLGLGLGLHDSLNCEEDSYGLFSSTIAVHISI